MILSRNRMGNGLQSYSRNKRKGYKDVSLDFIGQSYQAKEKAFDLSSYFSRSNMALALANTGLLAAYGAGIPRYDFDINNSALGLLIEPSTNQRLYVPQSTLPSANNMTGVSSAIDGPGGTANSTRFVELATNAQHRFTLNYKSTSPVGNTITSNIIIRPYNRNYFYLRYAAGTTMYNIAFTYDPAANTMVCSYSVPGTTYGHVRYVGNGYWMLSATIIGSTAALNAMYFGTKDSPILGDQLTDVTFMGNANSGFDYYWASVSDGVGTIFPWNIAVTGADTLTVPVNLENASRLLIGLEFSTKDMTGAESTYYPGVFKLGNSETFSIGAYIRNTMELVIRVVNASGTVIYTGSIALTKLNNNKLAIGYDNRNLTVVLNGTVGLTTVLSEYLPKMTSLALGRYDQTFNGWLRKASIQNTSFSPSDLIKATS